MLGPAVESLSHSLFEGNAEVLGSLDELSQHGESFLAEFELNRLSLHNPSLCFSPLDWTHGIARR